MLAKIRLNSRRAVFMRRFLPLFDIAVQEVFGSKRVSADHVDTHTCAFADRLPLLDRLLNAVDARDSSLSVRAAGCHSIPDNAMILAAQDFGSK
jgi:hypothetical protein